MFGEFSEALPVSTRGFLEALDGMEALTLEDLAGRIAHAILDWRWIASSVRFDLERYHRALLEEVPGRAVMIASWLPGQASPIHDHGGAEGVTRVLAGALEETLFDRVGDGARPRWSRVHHPGAVFLEHEETLHQVRNASERPAVSLHLYRPRLAELRTYRLIRG